MMSSAPTPSSAQLALAIRRLRAERAGSDLVNSDPIAIVGMGCRYPGNVRSPQDFWRLLRDGIDAVSKAPPDRWDESYFDPDPQSPGKMNSCWGGFLSGVDLFDPLLFGISPREASSIDPQQRLLLEVCWETIWDSGRAPESLAGSQTGVFIAMSNSDYERLLFADSGAIGPHSCTGGYRSVASGRISFLLDLHGPSISMDTACSSSLSVIHGACQSLRTGECNLAFAGGVTLHLVPGHYIGLAKLGMLAPEGRCRTFDASANGFVPSEGCGMVALKRLADALSDGDRIYAVIRGTALNQDGRTNVLTAPNGLAQQGVIRAALENAHVRASDITYVETHGTGTELGDPIEVEALAGAIGESSSGALPCALGAVKTNIGHLEAAAGMAGLMKAALALEHQEIPKNLHFEKLNPHISLAGTRFFLPTSNAPWPRGEAPRFAGVSSFGFSGTNAHIILEEAPRVQKRQEIVPRAARPYLLPISARTPEALQSYARAYQSFLQEGGRAVPLYNICHTASCRRSHLEERFALTAANHDDLLRSLEVIISGESRPGIARGRADRRTDNIVFVCSGQGSQWAQMGTSLMCDEPVFRAAIEDCEQAIQKHGGWSLVEELSASEQQSKLGDTEYAQPAIFAIEVGLARLWQSWGIVPAAIIGHSVGEVAAAHIAGVLSLDEAARVVVARGRLMQAATGKGKMAMVHLPAAGVMNDLASGSAGVSIAAVNSPESTVISGDPNAVEELLARWRGKGIDCRPLPVNYAFHSAQMRPYSEALVHALGSVERNPEKIPIISTVLGRYTRGDEFDAAYWGRNVLQTVRFGPAVLAAMDRGLNTYIEVGPHPVLLSSVGECLGVNRSPENLIPSIRRNQDELTVMLSSLGTLFASGSSIEWKNVYRKVAPAVAVPTYPYQRQRYWLETKPAPQAVKLHPLLGGRVRSPSIKGIVFETRVDTDSIPYLKDHKIEGRVLLPMTAFIEMVRLAARQAAGGNKALLDVTILETLEFNDDGSLVQVVLEDDGFHVFSQEGEQWKLHATGRIGEVGSPGNTQTIPASADFSGSESHYARLENLGVDFGPAFRTVESLSIIPGEAWVHVLLLEAEKRDSARYLFHPALLDGCLQAAVAAASAGLETAYFPFSFERFEMYQPVGDELWARAILRPSGDRDLLSDIDIRSKSGEPLARVVGLHMRQRNVPAASRIYSIEWREALRSEPQHAITGKLLIIPDNRADGEALVGALRDRGCDVRLANPDLPLGAADGVGTVIRLGEPDVPGTLLLVQELIARFSSRPPHLWLITRGAVAATPTDQCEGIWQAPVWGMARTVAMEHPELRCTRVDLDPNTSDYRALANEITNWDGEEEVAFREEKRLVPRLARTRDSVPVTQWTVPERGLIEKLALAPLQRRTPAAGEVEVEVEASALNFRDVLNVLGMYPGDPGQPGIDFCGRIARVGAGVTYQPGDRVMGIGQGTLASFVTTSAALVGCVPAGWAPTTAAAVPNVFLTAWHCLVRLGKLQRGERILIHAGAGGVGLAAIQVAQQLGAEIFATAGTEEKREYLQSLGVTHSFSSRTLDFVREIAAITGGKGVDLVLNSLAGEFIDAGFATLAPGGRFVEIGKNGIWTAERVAALEKPVRYFVVDLTTVVDSTPETIQADLFAFRKDFEAGTLRPIPIKVFEFEDAAAAFRYMAQAKHVGKIVLRHPVGPRIAPDATYLITGGLGAIGLEMAGWLVAGGARHLVLLGRNTPSSQAREAIEKIRNTGTQVEIRAVDVAQRAELEKALRELDGAMPPLAGIIHAAGVLEDGVITQQNADRIARVMAPKAIGAWNLHELTAAMPLDFFILCSSVASLTGSPAQAGYAAANAFLDALAHYRRARGLSALSVNWGAWPNAGMAARVHEQGRRQALPCITPMSVDDCLRGLEQAVASGRAQVAIADVDWLQLGSAPRLISGLTPGRVHPKTARPADDFLTRLEASLPGNRRKLLMDFLSETARQILGLSSSYQIDPRQSLMQIGLDSLMAVEFRNQLATALKRPLSATVLFDHPTIAALADFLENRETPAPEKSSDDLLDGLEGLSEDDAALMLRMELERGSR